VDRCPRKPSGKAAYFDVSCLQHSETPPGNGHTSFVEVLEWLCRLSTTQKRVNVFTRVMALLYCHLGNSG
jgi:hypothetical protein